MIRRTRRIRRPTIDTAAQYEDAFWHAVYLEPGGKELTREEFNASLFASDNDLREFYEAHRAEFAALAKIGTRHPLTWRFDIGQARDLELVEWEQLERLGLLTDDEIEALRQQAIQENDRLHAFPSHGSEPFRRSPLFWRFVASEPRDPTVFESSQLSRMNCLTAAEAEILADPSAALQGRMGPRSRFYYLPLSERVLLGLDAGHSRDIDRQLWPAETL